MGKSIDMTGFFKEMAAKGRNPFGMVTHVDGKRIRKVPLAKAFPGESAMDKIKTKFGSDSNYRNRARVDRAYAAKSKALKHKVHITKEHLHEKYP